MSISTKAIQCVANIDWCKGQNLIGATHAVREIFTILQQVHLPCSLPGQCTVSGNNITLQDDVHSILAIHSFILVALNAAKRELVAKGGHLAKGKQFAGGEG